MNIFEPFNLSLKEHFNDQFNFVSDFQDFFYSHPQEIVFVIIVVTLLTSLDIKHHDNECSDELFKLVNKFEEEDKESKVFISEILKQVLEAYNSIEKKIIEEESV